MNEDHCNHPEVTMTDNGLTLRTRYSQLPIAAVLATNEIASALVVILTAVGHLRYRGEDPTSEERYPSQIRPTNLADGAASYA
jgi:hypothetical protein